MSYINLANVNEAHLSDTAVAFSDPETQPRMRSAQVTGASSQISARLQLSDQSEFEQHNQGLISSDEHTDPSSQEFATAKDTFRAASTATSKNSKPKKARAASTAKSLTARTSLLSKRPTTLPKPKVKKAAATNTVKKVPKPRAKKTPRQAGSDGPNAAGKGSSDESSTKVKKAAAKSTKGTLRRKKVVDAEDEDFSDTGKTAANDYTDDEVPTVCGCGLDHNHGEMLECDGCHTWKHAVCMG